MTITMPDLSVNFCGVRFPNPFCLSSSPVSNTAEMVLRAFEAGWGGAVYKTLGIEQKFKVYHPSPRLNALNYDGKQVVGIQNVEQITDRPLSDNLRDLSELKRQFPDRVVISSIMGFSEEDWALLAKSSEDAGADMLELNFSCPQMAKEGAGHKVGQAEDLIELYTAVTKKASRLPVIAKMTPNITDMVPPALAAKRGGADAISAINTMKAISQVDIDSYIPRPNVAGKSSISGFSGPACKPTALRFIAELAKAPELGLPISGMGGIVTWVDAVQFMLLGATTIQATTSIMRYGYRIVEDMIEGVGDYLLDKGFASAQDIVGRALANLVDPAELSYETVALSVIDQDTCIGCGQCYVACQDGANQAISLNEQRKAVVDEERCVGCLMCMHLCPVPNCVSYKSVPRSLASAQ